MRSTSSKADQLAALIELRAPGFVSIADMNRVFGDPLRTLALRSEVIAKLRMRGCNFDVVRGRGLYVTRAYVYPRHGAVYKSKRRSMSGVSANMAETHYACGI